VLAPASPDRALVVPEPPAAPCVTSDYFLTILDVLKIPLPADRLYDIPADPTESKDLAAKLSEVKARMEAHLKDWKDGVMKELQAVGK
jgi:hypothetical protein